MRDRIIVIIIIAPVLGVFLLRIILSASHVPTHGSSQQPVRKVCVLSEFYRSRKLRHHPRNLANCQAWKRLEEETAPTPMCLPGESQGRGAWWAAVSGVAQNWTRLKRLSSSSSSSSHKYIMVSQIFFCASGSWHTSFILPKMSIPSSLSGFTLQLKTAFLEKPPQAE